MAYVKDPRVDAYLDPLPTWQREIFSRVRDRVHEADPELERLLAEEEEIERRIQEHHETPHFRGSDD